MSRLDIAMNDMMGNEFAVFVNKYLESQGYPTESIAKINSNPEKSKHLETATTKLFGQEVDFCNLRTEVYEPGSRIPSNITFGTPKQDAFRRDTTINSLFYNVNTMQVEDFTELGIHDLVHGIIRTPNDAFETFLDDPLRVIRCIRFSSRFDFQMTSELTEACQHPEIAHALKTKISRERIGVEFEKMITGPHPLLSIQLIHQLQLYPIIIQAPQDLIGDIPDSKVALSAVGLIEALKGLEPSDANERRMLALCCCVLPFFSMEVKQKKKVVSASGWVLREALKTTMVDVNTVSTVFRGIPELQALANQKSVGRSELGMIIRDLGILWKTAVKLSAIKEQVENPNSDYEKYSRLIQQAQEYGIQDCYQWKHKLDGKKASEVIGLKPGSHVAELLNVQMVWQLENPDGSLEECEQVIRTYWTNK
ncbi:unnamed protein product [Rhizopus stolonifer]